MSRPPINEPPIKHPSLGAALVDRSLLVSLERLWEGPLQLSDIPKIEIALRAFLTAKELIVSRAFDPWEKVADPKKPAIDYEQPLNDHLLDYEFRDPSLPHPHERISKEEHQCLNEQYEKFVQNALSSVPREFTFEGEYVGYLDAWYQGEPAEACYENAKYTRKNFKGRFQEKQFSYFLKVNLQAFEHAKYVIGSARAGLMIYGSAPIYEFCNEHTFVKWPERLYEILEKKYHKTLSAVRSPRARLVLPPLTSIVLARARSREKIPSVIVGLRDEFAASRRELWEIMEQVWYGETLVDRISAARILKDNAKLMFKIPHSVQKNMLSLGLGIIPKNSSELSSELLDCFNELDAPAVAQIGVRAVSFARQLGLEMQGVLNAELSKFRTHFSESEIRSLNL